MNAFFNDFNELQLNAIKSETNKETLIDKNERVSFEDRLEKIDKQFDQLDISIKKLKNNNVNISDLEKQLELLRKEFDDVYCYVNSDTDKVQFFIKKFYDVHTAILNKERAFDRENATKNFDAELANISNNIDKFGSYDSKTKFRQLKNSYDNESSEENKKYLINEIRNLHVDVLFDSFDWLSNCAAFLVNKKVIYVNEQRADYWKNQLAVAYRSHNKQQLQKAVVELISLMEKSANENIGFVMADLKL